MNGLTIKRPTYRLLFAQVRSIILMLMVVFARLEQKTSHQGRVCNQIKNVIARLWRICIDISPENE